MRWSVPPFATPDVNAKKATFWINRKMNAFYRPNVLVTMAVEVMVKMPSYKAIATLGEINLT